MNNVYIYQPWLVRIVGISQRIKSFGCQEIVVLVGKIFSCGGKEVLIKMVAQAIPSYALSTFYLPETLCNAFQ